MMTEPEPCPFEQAQSSEEGREQDIDLLLNTNNDTEEDPDREIAAKRLSFLDSVKDSDRCPSKRSIG